MVTKIPLALLVLAAALLPSTQAPSQSRLVIMDGNELFEECEKGSDVCLGYVTAVADALEAIRLPRVQTCRPQGVEIRQVLEVAVVALRDNPPERHRPAFDLVADSLLAKWPC